MAAMPPAAGFSLASVGSFVVNLGASYMLGRLTAQDGPRLGNLEAANGDYGVPMPRLYGEANRLTGIFLVQAPIKETKHKVEDYSELVGAATGAIQGFMMGGPIGAVAGGILGGLFGAATPDQVFYTYSDTFALLLSDRTNDDPIEGVLKLWAGGKLLFSSATAAVVSQTFDSNGKLLKRKYGKNRWFKSLTIYGGGEEQDVDPILASKTGEVAGYIFRAYIVIEDLQLAKFGNSVPAVEALVVAKTGHSLADVAEAICGAGGIDHERNLSSTALLGQTIRGYQITSETNCWDALKPLLPVYRVDAAEVSGQIRFYRRSQAMRSIIPFEDMGGHIYGDSPPEQIRFQRATDIDLPKETAFTFLDPARDYQQNTASSQRSEGDARSNVSVSVALSLTATEGATAAATMHWDAWLGRTAASITLTDKWISLETGVAYGIPFGGDMLPFRVTRKTRGANGIIEADLVSDESVTYEGATVGDSGEMPDEEPTAFADTRIVLMDMPITGDTHDDYGFYVAQAGTADYWERAAIQASGNGTTYATIVDSSSETIIGDVVGTLAAGTTTGLDDTLDTTTVLTVTLLHSSMELSSVTDAQLDAFANFAYVGKNGLGEYLQFKTANQTGPVTWELTNLRRGRKGTDHAIATHASGEEFALLGQGGVFRIVYNDDDKWGDALTLRGVSLHQDEADAEVDAFTNTGEGKRPYSVVNVAGLFTGNDLGLTWDRRSRFNDGSLGTDAPEAYEVDILDGLTVVRTIAVSAEAATYTEAQQIADGFDAGGIISGNIYQVNTAYGRSRPRPFMFVGPNAALRHLEDGTTLRHLEDGMTYRELG